MIALQNSVIAVSPLYPHVRLLATLAAWMDDGVSLLL